MKLHEFFISSITILTLAACSSGSSSGDKNPSGKHDFTASDKISGQFAPGQELGKHSSKAAKELEMWKEECNKIDDFSLGSNFKAGLKVLSREDEIHLWPRLQSEGDALIYDRTVEKVVSAKEFISVDNQIAQDHSIKGRYRHTASRGGFSSALQEIISTSPPHIQGHIENELGSDDDDDNYVRCKHDYPNDDKNKSATTFASLTLKDGTKVNGILVTEHREYTNYTCGLYRQDDSLVKELKFADRVAEERMDFYSKELINPFESKCHDSSGLLSVETIRDISGNRGVITLRKEEVLSVSK